MKMMVHSRRCQAGLLALGVMAVLADRASAATIRADFNGDGFSDLAIGIPFDTVSGVIAAGGVNVLYGSPAGLTSAGSQLWTQDSPGVPGTPEEGDSFGYTLAAGDFNGDGRADLAITVRFDTVNGIERAGAVNVLYGSDSGLTAAGAQIWSQDSAGVPGAAEKEDWFGLSLAAADFNGDGRADLAIGAPSERVNGVSEGGAANVLYGSSSGLTSVGSQLWTQDSSGVPGIAEAGDEFGYALAARDFDGDGRADLAISAVSDSVNGVEYAGAVNVLYGSAAGLSSSGSQLWTQDSAGVPGTAESADKFGNELAGGDFNGDGRMDLAIAVYQDMVSGDGAGAVNVLYGSPSGLTATGSQIWSQDSPGVPGVAEHLEQFGRALETGDYDGDGRADLAVGVPGEVVSTYAHEGAVIILYGSGSGLTSAGSQLWSQASAGVPGGLESGDEFGAALGSGDFDGDGHSDLAVGVPSEDVAGVVETGAVNVLYGTAAGLTSSGSQLWSQASAGVPGVAEIGESFGFSLGRR